MDIDSLNSSQNNTQAVMAQISVAVTRQIQQSQKRMANALVDMIQQTTDLSRNAHQFKEAGLGENIDITA